MTLVSADGLIPPGGKFDKLSSGPIGIAKLRPVVVRDAASNGMKRNFPFDDHFGPKVQSHTSRDGPPSTGIALDSTPFPGAAVAAITHRRRGEIPSMKIMGYGTTFERPEPS